MNKVYFLLILTIAFSSCRKKKASWDSDYAIPLINDSLSLDNYVNDTTLAIGNASGYHLTLERELLSFDLSSEVKIPDTIITTSFSTPVNFNVPPGSSIINDAQEKDFSISNLELNTAIFSKGEIVVKVFNTYPTDVICTVLLPTTTKDGVQVTDQVAVGPGTIANPSVGEKVIDLSYCYMDLTGNAGNSFNILSYQINVSTDPGGIAVTNNPSNVTNVETKIQNLEIFYAKGYFGNRIISDTVETDVEVLKKWVSGDLDIQDVDLKITLSNTIKAMGRITIKELTTTKTDGTTTSLSSSQIDVPQNVNPATGQWETLAASELIFPFTTYNSNIEDFLENAGPKIKVVYEFELNPLGNITSSSNEIFPESDVKLDLSLYMPIIIGMTDLTLTDTIDLNLAKNADQIDRAQKAEIVANIENGFPIQGELLLTILDEQDQTVLSILSNQKIESSAYGVPNAQGVPTQKCKLIWSLTKDDLEKIKTGEKMIITGILNTPDPNGTTNTSVSLQEFSFLAAQIQLFLTYQNEL